MLQILNTKSAKCRKGGVRIDSNNKDRYDSKAKLDGRNKVGSIKIDSNKIRNNEVAEEKNHQKTFKSKNTSKSKKMIDFLNFFILKA